jgi:hypothetical protein
MLTNELILNNNYNNILKQASSARWNWRGKKNG